MSEHINSVCILGTGNVAWHYERRFKERGFSCVNISARNDVSCCIDADLVIIAVKDEAIEEVVNKLKGMKGILVHTSGFMSTDCLAVATENYGSLYPLQSLKKNKETDFDKVTLCTYGNNERVRALLGSVAKELSSVNCELSDKQRKSLHIAAVFCNNFTNHLFGIARSILEKEKIPFDILFPLIDMTIDKVKQFNPFDVQTGPAVRNEKEIMRQHKEMLGKDECDIYELLSNKIISYHSKEK